MILKKLLLSVLAVVFSATFCLAAEKWDMPTPYPATNFHTLNIQQFAADLDKATGGGVKITVHPNASLFKMTEIKRAVQTGQVQIGEVIFSSLENEDPLMGVDSVPFLASGYAESKKLWDVSKNEITNKFAKQGLKLLFTVPWPPQGLYTKKEINSTADMKGLKLRSYNPAISRIAELVGAQPVTIQAAELAQALATGTVNSFISSSATGVDTKAWEQMQYFYDVKAWLPKNVIFMNQKVFDSLDAKTKDIVLKTAKAAEERGWKKSEENYQDTVKILSGKMKVMSPSAKLKSDLDKIGKTMSAEWIKKAGSSGQAIVDAYDK